MQVGPRNLESGVCVNDGGETPRGPVTPDRLRAAFRRVDFDGREAQRAMEPARRGARPGPPPGGPPRDAGALAYLFERDGRLRLPLTTRSEHLPEHRGQVSLPGGRPHRGEDLLATARREAREEIGLDVAEMEVVGRLAPVAIPVSHSRLHVFVALGPDPGPFVPDPREVQRITLVSLDDLLRPDARRERPWTIGRREILVPYFDVGGLFLWGATAMALSELVARLRTEMG